MGSTRSGSDAAAASSGLGGYWNRLQILVVMVWKPAGSARIAGEPNKVIACKNATRAPASKAGSTRGMVILRAVYQRPPPKIDDASSNSPGVRSSELATSTKTYGNV